ncbi:MAG: hypothetical protein AMXMBFR84_02050 [Candidatus Hydrogenedentota bacterium]
MTKNRAWLGLFLLGLWVVGCGNPPGETGDSAKTSAQTVKTIGVSLLTQRHQFFRDLTEGLEEAAAANGFTLRVQYAEFDGPRQFNQIETFVNQKVDAIIVSPKDSEGIAPAIEAAVKAGIPVFTSDIAAKNAPVTSHIASDNVQGGRLIGEYLANLLGGKGQVAIIDHAEATSVQDRVRGFEEALSKYPDMKIVQKAPGGGVRDKAMRAAQDVLQANPDLTAIFGINDDSALGAMAAVESGKMQDKIIIVGYDGTPEACEAILAERPLKADTVQYPKEIAKKTIETVAAHFRGETVPPVVPVEVGIVDKEVLIRQAVTESGVAVEKAE